MNVFQFLYLPANHRPTDKVVQLVRNFEEREKQLQKFLDRNPNEVLYAQAKKDGVYAMAVIEAEFGDHVCQIFGRTGKKLKNVEHLEAGFEEWANDELFQGVIIFELCNSSCSLEELSGIVNPNRTKPLSEMQEKFKDTLWMFFHDILTLNDFKEGTSKLPYYERHLQLFDMNRVRYSIRGSILPSIPVETLEEFEEFAQNCIEVGEEGAVLKMPNQRWKAGQKNEVMTKIVRGVDYDLEVVGFEEGKGKRSNMVANLHVRWKMYGEPAGEEVILAVDGRFTDEQRIAWWNGDEDIVGRIVHVHALQLGSKGSLRLPKVRAVRIDKTVADL